MRRSKARSPRVVGVALFALVMLVFPSAATAATDLPPGGTFVDDDGNVHEGSIEAIAAAGITRGCQSPAVDLYCPDDPLTRAEMAAMFVRALGLGGGTNFDRFRDDDGSIYERDIEAFAAAGITRGCNPPANDRFCPDGTVTRGQGAAFFVRAFGYTSEGTVDFYTDDNGSIFESDINRIATAGVAFSCNPPINDRYCPGDLLTRDVMAHMLTRALGLTPIIPPPRPAPPAVTASLDPIEVDTRSGSFVVRFSCVGEEPVVVDATLNGLAVADGQEVVLILTNGKASHRVHKGVLTIRAGGFELTVTCSDGSGLSSTATASAAFEEKPPMSPPVSPPVGPPPEPPGNPSPGPPVTPPSPPPVGPPMSPPVGPPTSPPIGPPEGRPVSPPCRPLSPPVSPPVSPGPPAMRGGGRPLSPPPSPPVSPPRGCPGAGGLAGFLGHPGGLAVTVVSAAALVLGAAVTRRRDTLGVGEVFLVRTTRQRTEAALLRDASGGAPTAVRVLAAGAVVLPLVFTLTHHDAFALPKTVGLVVVTGLALASLAATRVAPRRTVAHPIDFAVAAFVGLNVVAWLLSPDLVQSFFGERFQYQGLMAVLAYAVVFFIARRTVALGGARHLGVWVAAGSAIVAAYAVAQQAGWDPIWDELYPPGRVFSTFGQPNALAAYLALALPVVVASAAIASRRRRWLLAAVATMSVVALLFTLSRGAYAAAAAGLVFAAALAGWRPRPSGRGTRYALVGAIFALVAVTIAMVPTFRDGTIRAGNRVMALGDLNDGGSVQMHVDLWRVGAAVSLDNPVTGIGQEMFPTEFPRYRDAVLEPDRADVFASSRPESPHNVYIATAVGAGVPALVLYLAIVTGILGVGVGAVRRAAAGPSRQLLIGFTAAIAAHAVTDLFMTAEPVGSWMMWIFMAVVLALADAERFRQSGAVHPLPGHWR